MVPAVIVSIIITIFTILILCCIPSIQLTAVTGVDSEEINVPEPSSPSVNLTVFIHSLKS